MKKAGLTLPESLVLASIGPVTSETIKKFGYEPTLEAKEYTIPGLVSALIDFFGRG